MRQEGREFPDQVGWPAMPEVIFARELAQMGAMPPEVRIALTLLCAMDRARDANALWNAGEEAFRSERWIFRPSEVVQRQQSELLHVLRSLRVSQRHGQDAAAWWRICHAIAHDRPPVLVRVLEEGMGDAQDLLKVVDIRARDDRPMFPLLRGPKIRQMWVRILADPGGAKISRLKDIDVAVDTHVLRITRMFALVQVAPKLTPRVKSAVQAAWRTDVLQSGAEGTEALRNTCAGLDPALWFFAKWGCKHCELQGRRVPFHAEACSGCTFNA